MNPLSGNASPKYRNLGIRSKQSPKELKDKMRKNYKDKVQNSRKMLMDRLRGPIVEQELCNALTDIFKSMADFTGDNENYEMEVLEELKNELVQEELEWWLLEYEKCQMDNFDWSTVEDNENVICPVCIKSNFQMNAGRVSCMNCNIIITTHKTLSEIKTWILTCVEKHHTLCSHEPEFSVIREADETHIYLICNACSEMTMIL